MAQVPGDALGAQVFHIKQDGGDPSAGHVDPAFHVLGGVQRRRHRYGLAPTGDLAGIGVERGLDEVALFFGFAHERRFERGDERYGYVVQSDG